MKANFMKRTLILLIACTCLGLSSTPASATNDYSKCPDNWKLTTTDDSVLQQELAEAKALLGGNFAVSIVSREIQDSGTWKVFATEKFSNPSEYLWLQLLQLPMRTNLRIEVKGCQNPLNISSPLSLGNITIIKSSYSTLYDDMLKYLPQSISTGDLTYRIKNSNFKQLEDSINLLKATVDSIRRDLSSGANNPKRGSFKYNEGGSVRESILLAMKPVSDQIVANGLSSGGFYLLPSRLSCVVLSASISSPLQGPFKWIPQGTSCNYQLVVYLPTINTMFQIDSVMIQTVTYEITCVKGKVTKKITGVNPKCPTGYVKK
jgi:hypothetical protein